MRLKLKSIGDVLKKSQTANFLGSTLKRLSDIWGSKTPKRQTLKSAGRSQDVQCSCVQLKTSFYHFRFPKPQNMQAVLKTSQRRPMFLKSSFSHVGFLGHQRDWHYNLQNVLKTSQIRQMLLCLFKDVFQTFYILKTPKRQTWNFASRP